ncbi:MAG: hypothetical protein MI754_12015 [Chromatiales bacterium]|nr:hypothetical protein [Chromatiales bacterium]
MSRFRDFTNRDTSPSHSTGEQPPIDSIPQLMLDEDGIPILNDVVVPEHLDSDDEILAIPDQDLEPEPVLSPSGTTQSSFNLNLPKHEALLAAMRDRLHNRLMKDLTPVIPKIAEQVAAEIAADFEQQFQARFNQALKQEIETLIDETIDQELGQ